MQYVQPQGGMRYEKSFARAIPVKVLAAALRVGKTKATVS